MLLRALIIGASAASASITFVRDDVVIPGHLSSAATDFLPTVIWHGLGDSADSEGIKSLVSLISNHTNSPTFAISVGSRDASFVGDANAQIAGVCAALASEPLLAGARGINALGLSQGGQFLRGYAERCNAPAVGTLMTWGSQHAGISEVPCGGGEEGGTPSRLCVTARYLVRTNAFSSWVQSHVVPASYYRGKDEDAYRKGSQLLADINNERSSTENRTYADNLKTLHNFVMVKFEDDMTVIPKVSSHFAVVDGEDVEVPVEKQGVYKALGLNELVRTDRLHRLTVPGRHMEIDDDTLLAYIDKYFARVGHMPKQTLQHHGL
ncbi:hypothetical protein PYCC9005_004350 [Savitreella phatthalungensis]